jgi:hypothetical protein
MTRRTYWQLRRLEEQDPVAVRTTRPSSGPKVQQHLVLTQAEEDSSRE